jgi:hypothetical protein
MIPPTTLQRGLFGLLISLFGSIGVHAHPAGEPAVRPPVPWMPPLAVVRPPVLVRPVTPPHAAMPEVSMRFHTDSVAPAHWQRHPHHHPHHPLRRHGWVRDDNHDGIVDGYHRPGRNRHPH